MRLSIIRIDCKNICDKAKQFSLAAKSNNSILPALGIALFVFYIFTQRWFELYLQVRTYQVLTIGLSLALVTVGLIDCRPYKNQITLIDLLWFPAIMIIIINIFLVGYSKHLSPLFFYGSGYLFLLLAKVNINTYRSALTLVKFGGLFYALGSIAQYFYTDSFNKFIFNYTISTSQQRIIELTSSNYYPGFAFGQTSIAAGHTAMALGIILVFWDKAKTLAGKFCDVTLFGVIFFGLMITGRRTMLIWAVFALLLTFWFLSDGKYRLRRLYFVAGIAVILVLGTLAIFHFFEMPQFLIRFESMFNDLLAGNIPESLQVRFNLYEQAWGLFTDNIFTGIGWFEFQSLNPNGHHVHNAPLQLLAEMGIIGFIAVIIPVVYVYYSTVQAYYRAAEYGKDINPLWCKGLAYSFFYQTFFLTYSLSDTPFFHIVFVLMYFFSLSIVNSFIIYEKSAQIRTQVPLNE